MVRPRRTSFRRCDSLKGLLPPGRFNLEPKQVKDLGELMGTHDQINRRYGRGTVLLASTGLAGDHRRWAMKQERRTPQYTTRWEDMPVIRA